MTVKKIIGFCHLWLGLISGIVVFVVCITAAIWVFSPEIESMTQPYRHVMKQDKPFLPVSVLREKAEKSLPGKKANGMAFGGYDKSAVAFFYGKEYYYGVYMNPYTGAIKKVKNEEHSFFSFIITGHYTLWMGEVGGEIVKWATVIFLLMLISGIVLWWPRNKAARKQRFKVKWSASFKRLNYDLHNVFGFYAAWITLFAVLTGLIWCFEWLAKTEYWIASGGQEEIPHAELHSIKSTDTLHGPTRLDSVFYHQLKNYEGRWGLAEVFFASSDSGVVEIAMFPREGVYYNGDYYHYDQYTLKEMPVPSWGIYADANGGEKLSRMNYDIHIGSILGLPGRIAMFLAVLVGASLPITGFLIWKGRRRKKLTR